MKIAQFKNMLNCLLLISAFVLSSCGYVSDKPPANLDVFTAGQLQGCKIDIDKLGEIFKADQKEQIRCLEENLIQFTKYVRSKDSGSISEKELNAFIRKFFQGQSDSIVKGLSLIFQLNMLLLRDEATRISRTNISPLFELLVKVNQEAIIITRVLKEMDDEKNQDRFWELRSQFNSSLTRFSEGTIRIIKKSPGLNQKLNIKEFILEASKKLGSKVIKPETIDSLIFLKRILAGGEKEIITTDELVVIIGKLPKILSMSFDLYFIKKTNFTSDTNRYRFYLNTVRDLYSVIEFNQNNFQLITIDQLLGLTEEFIEKSNMRKFKSSIVAIKGRLVGGEKESFSLRDSKIILDIAHDFVERNYFNVVTYNVYRGALEKTTPITYLQQLDLPDQYDVFSLPSRVTELHRDFLEIAVGTRYFRTEKEKIPYYGVLIKRTQYGFLEASLMNWVTVKLMKGYGHKNADGIAQVSVEEFQTFLNDMKPLLEEFKLWSPNPATFARNAILLADLFQNRSNGDLEVNINEAAEYMQMILSSAEISGKFRAELAKVCETGISEEDAVFETSCFNKFFFETMLNKLDYKKFFPHLNDYVLNSQAFEVEEYLHGVEGFARDNPDPQVPVNKRDNILILGAMLNIESTFIRFDSDKDNIIDYKELTVAFKVYQSAIISMAKLRPSEEVYAKSIFLYMVSKMEIPPMGTWMQSANFFAFHKCVASNWCRETFMDKVEAKRLNVGKLLYYMTNQNTIAAGKNK